MNSSKKWNETKMTEKQRNFLIYLDIKCKEQNINIRADDDDLLGKDWLKDYQNFTPKYTLEVIDKLKMALGMPITTFSPRKSRKRK